MHITKVIACTRFNLYDVGIWLLNDCSVGSTAYMYKYMLAFYNLIISFFVSCLFLKP